MTEESVSIVTKPRDYSDVIQLQDPRALEEFLEQPLTYIAETMTGALAVGKYGTMASGGRIVQGLLKGRLFQQFNAEFRKLREAGKIPDDFAEKRYGFQTWVELMTIIDEESPDADRLDALKAMFYDVNKLNATDGERVAAYHLWQLAKGLSSGEILLLRTAYSQRTTYHSGWNDYRKWRDSMAQAIGHEVRGLIDLHEKRLSELGIFTARQHGDGSGINPANARLTELGVSLCRNIENYQLLQKEIAFMGDEN
jgi:hypothetical protein